MEARGGIEPPNKGFADLHRAPTTRVESIRNSGDLDLRPVSVRSDELGHTSKVVPSSPRAFEVYEVTCYACHYLVIFPVAAVHENVAQCPPVWRPSSNSLEGCVKIGEPCNPAPGEEFNPRRKFVGLFIPEALAASAAISSTAKLAYGHLVRRAGENGRCWPSAADVAKYTGVKERAAQRALKELQSGDHPLIRATFRRDEKGRQTSNEYAFIWSPILGSVKSGSPVKNDTLPLSKTTPPGLSETTGTTLSKTTPEKCQKKSVTGKGSEESASRTVQHHRRGREAESRRDDDAAYRQHVLELLQRREGTPRTLSAGDQALCCEWERQGVPLEVVGRAITLGCLRKHAAAINNGTGPVRIGSLKYFAGVLPEAQDPASGPEYWAHLEQRPRRVEAGIGICVDGDDRVNDTAGDAAVQRHPPEPERGSPHEVAAAGGAR